MKALSAALLLVSPAMAQDLINYDLLLRQNAGRVVVTADAEGRQTRTLDMGDGVVVRCDDSGCTGMDMSGKGALGCTFAIFTELQAFAEVCEPALDAAGKTAMAEAFDAVGQIVARNAVPPRSSTYPQEVLDAVKDRLRANAGPDLAAQCRADADGDAGQMLQAVVQAWQAGASRPDPADRRLPVMNPCL